jgi:hypothetical protein
MGLPAPMPEQTPEKPKKQGTYTIRDAMQVADDILDLSREKQYAIGAFVHGQIFALEFTTVAYGVPAQQVAEIKRDCRKYITEMMQVRSQQPHEHHGEEEPVQAPPAQETEQKPEETAQQKPEEPTEEMPAQKTVRKTSQKKSGQKAEAKVEAKNE